MVRNISVFYKNRDILQYNPPSPSLLTTYKWVGQKEDLCGIPV